MRRCYEYGLARDAGLRGRVLTTFVIGEDGLVSDATDHGSDMPDAEVVRCVAALSLARLSLLSLEKRTHRVGRGQYRIFRGA